MNTLLCTDVYKMGHMQQYPEGTTEVYSYLEARKVDENKQPYPVVFFGLQYILKKYLCNPITTQNMNEFYYFYTKILGPVPDDVIAKLSNLVKLGYWPLEIKAVPEGTVIPSKNILLSIRNTHPDFHWCVGFIESLILKVWNPCSVATLSRKYLELVQRYADETCQDHSHIPFSVHDFGYRAASSEETAQISGAAHLLNFTGSDNIPAAWLLENYYQPLMRDTILSQSIPASEHSVMCSFGPDNEWLAFDNMLKLYDGPVSIVSDTYDYFSIIRNYTNSRFKEISEHNGKVVFRPDSGDPVKVICGDPNSSNEDERKGSLDILWETFGGTFNNKGFRVLNPKVGLIYGDAMYYERFELMLETMKKKNYATSNLVIGVGGILLQNHSRDEFGFALKATHIVRNDESVEVFKDPKTDQTKKSKKGFMRLELIDGEYATIDQQANDEGGLLIPVYRDGRLLKDWTLEEVRNNGKTS